MIKSALHNILQDNKNQKSLHLDQGAVTYASPRDNQVYHEISPNLSFGSLLGTEHITFEQ